MVLQTPRALSRKGGRLAACTQRQLRMERQQSKHSKHKDVQGATPLTQSFAITTITACRNPAISARTVGGIGLKEALFVMYPLEEAAVRTNALNTETHHVLLPLPISTHRGHRVSSPRWVYQVLLPPHLVSFKN